MFASAERTVPLDWATARRALEEAIDDGGLVEQSRRADEAGHGFVMPVGPRGADGPTRDVIVLVAEPSEREGTLTVPIRWEVPGASGRLFPALDAEVILSPEVGARSRLSVLARYEPPLGRIGHVADRLVMARIANATMSEFLRELDERIRQCASSTHDRQAETTSPDSAQ